jgi:methionyl-tRNA formyltransferase
MRYHNVCHFTIANGSTWEGAMRITIVGQRDFGKAVLDAFLDRGDTVAGVFCAPEKPGATADPLLLAAEQRQIPLHQFGSLKTE